LKRKQRNLSLNSMFKMLLNLRREMLRIDNTGIHIKGNLEKYQSAMEFLVNIMWFEAYYGNKLRLKDSVRGFG